MARMFSWPSWPQWRQLPKVLTKKERLGAIVMLIFAVGSGAAWLRYSYVQKTNVIPAYGGVYSEALIGEPQFINPLLTGTSDVDRDIAALVYSGLMKYDKENAVVPDLAERYEISNENKTYTFFLKKNIFWHDGKPFTADDVLFTLEAIVNPDYGSPLRQSWQGVTVEKQDDYTIAVTLPRPYAQFPHKTTIGIIPKHIWSSVNPKNINLADANLKPVGTGPFKFKKFSKDKFGNIISFSLEAYQHFDGGQPYLDGIEFSFYGYDDEAIDAFKKRKVMGIAYVSPGNEDAISLYRTHVYHLNLPKYFSVFFNQINSKAIADKNIRHALTLGTNKEAIRNEVFKNNATLIESPILPWFSGIPQAAQRYLFSEEAAKKILEQSGWKDKDSDGVREKIIGSDKEATRFEITLVTSDFPDLIRVGELLKTQWEKIGAQVNLESEAIDELKQQVIKPRKYDALLFGEVVSQYPDLYPFWHSSQKKDPGLNLALYDNKTVDQNLEELRQTYNQDEQNAKLGKIQNALAEDIPAIFLFSPHYLYAISTDVHNITAHNINTAASRFTDSATWYIKTKRVEKVKTQ